MGSQRQVRASHTGSHEPLPSSPSRLSVCPASVLVQMVQDHPLAGTLQPTPGLAKGRERSARAEAEDKLAPPQAVGGMAGFCLSPSVNSQPPPSPLAQGRHPLRGLAQELQCPLFLVISSQGHWVQWELGI